MKILYLCAADQDNLEDAYLHGLRMLYGTDVVDYPRKDSMYRDFVCEDVSKAYGRLFTIWRTLENVDVDRTDIESKIRNGFYDYVIVGSIDKSISSFLKLKPILKKRNTIVLDGGDLFRYTRGTFGWLTFKRELSRKFSSYVVRRVIPRILYQRMSLPRWVLPISFAIPREKITYGLNPTLKTQQFPLHIVDAEVRDSLGGDYRTTYAYETENDYYADLQRSMFGITTKRGGWDCLRHYEIAANGSVICFRDLTSKEVTCAPHHLQHMKNCVVYHSFNDLQSQLKALSTDQYSEMLAHSYQWVESMTTTSQAADMLDRAQKFFEQ